MSFSRRGLDELTAAVDAGRLDAVLVKDLSRLGRHRTQTALFIDYLRERGVRVISVTEGLDTTSDEDDLVIGVRGLMNDYYAKDIGKKIRTGYRQKQREGIVITPPFGYWKDRNTNTVKLHPEAAETVRMIYSLYLQGFGQKELARRLNDLGERPRRSSSGTVRREVRAAYKTRDNRYLWTYASIKNVLTEEAILGFLSTIGQKPRMARKTIGTDRMVSPRKLLPGHRGTGCLETSSATAEGACPASQRKSLQAPLCRSAPVPGVRQCIRPHDPVLEWQAACGVCLQGLPSEWEKLLQLPPYPRGKSGYHGMGVFYGGSR